jgi:hypothetical protein
LPGKITGGSRQRPGQVCELSVDHPQGPVVRIQASNALANCKRTFQTGPEEKNPVALTAKGKLVAAP